MVLVLLILQLLLLMLALFSTRYWYQLFKAKNGTTVFPLYPERCTLEMSLPVILAILWIAMQMSSSMQKLWMKWQNLPIPTQTISLDQVIGSCLTSFTFGVILIITLLLPNQKFVPQLVFRLNDKKGQLQDGAIGFVLALLPVMLFLFLTEPLRTEKTLHPLFQLLKAQPQFSTIAWIFVSAVVVAPLFEELIYRVLFQSWLERVLPAFAAIFTSSLVFSLVHGFPDFIPLFPLAFLLGMLFYYRRSYASVVITHALFNGTNLALALLEQHISS